ncbi:MAG: hypothetical protein IT307_11885 [Chloroflexi bacterium]|nr:hypothetical protein [Chloroflexota bacterium]
MQLRQLSAVKPGWNRATIRTSMIRARRYGLLFLVSAVTVELTLRLIGYQPALLNAAMFVKLEDTTTVYGLQENYRGYYVGKTVTTDGRGLRTVVGSDATSGPRGSLLLLGDSVVFGQGLTDDQTLASVLQRRFLQAGPDIRVTNIGVPGYTSWNELGALSEFADQLAPSFVLLVYVPNDVSSDNDQLGIARGRFTNLSDSWLSRLSQVAYRSWYTSFFMRGLIGRVQSLAGNKATQGFWWETVDQTDLQYSMQAIAKIRELCERIHAELSVAIYRDQTFRYDEPAGIRYEQSVGTALDALGVDHFVLSAHIDKLTPIEGMASSSDPHPSARATELLAQQILDRIGRRLSD